MDYPPNSKLNPAEPPKDKKVEQVTTVEAKRRKKSLGTQFKETFVGGDARTATHYVIFSVLIPAAKEAMVDAGRDWIERLVFGESRGMRGRRPPGSATGHISYQSMYKSDRGGLPPQRAISKESRARFDFDDIVLDSRSEAETVLDRLFDILSRYEEVTVADLYLLTGIKANHTDHKWGWTNLRGATVTRLRSQGYLLDLPDPEPL